jgi:type IX secretion system PorP/SprF family membrane protein
MRHRISYLSDFNLKKWLFIALGLISFNALGQQDPGLSMFSLNSSHLNPAFSGWRQETSVQMHIRNQWSGYESTNDGGGNLGTQFLTASMPLGLFNTGIGFLYMSDKTPSGVGMQTVRLQLAHHYALGSGLISTGIRVGMQAKSFDGRVFRVRDTNDPLSLELSGKMLSQSLPDFGFGMVYSKDSWNAGISLDHLTSPVYTFSSNTASMPLAMVLSAHAGAEILVNTLFDFLPFGQIRYYSGKILPEMGARMEYRDMFWIGGSYRLNDAAIGMVGVSLLNNRINLGYSMDYTLVNLDTKSLLSHEIFIKFNLPTFKLGLEAVPIKTPRFKIN